MHMWAKQNNNTKFINKLTIYMHFFSGIMYYHI